MPSSAEEIRAGSTAVYWAAWLALTLPVVDQRRPGRAAQVVAHGPRQGLAAEGRQRRGERRRHDYGERRRDNGQAVCVHPWQRQRPVVNPVSNPSAQEPTIRTG